MSRFKTNIFAVLGASSLLGNPIQFVNSLGTGVRDFFYKPFDGFIENGAIEGGRGFIDGTGSLLKNTV